MKRSIIEDLHQYFEQKENKNGAEVSFLNQLTEELPYFQITAISREDLAQRGFDVSEVDDEDMRELARKMESDYCEQLYWESMVIIAEQGLEIPKYVCPKCGEGASRYDSNDKTFECNSCDHNWKLTEPTGRYVLVQFPVDSSFFENHDIGYPSFNQEDNGARYVPEHLYKAHFEREADANTLFITVGWPDSQRYFELEEENKSVFELCEPIIADDKALNDFDSSSIWVPLCAIKAEE